MNSDIVIRAEGLGKKYRIGHQASNESYVALRDVIARAARGLARSARDMMRGRELVAGDEVEEFWALKDVNFEIRRGDVVGIIGRNGAGKSTLLKILSRITEPSAGRVEIKGRVASLLEVGTGFHPELSGRENIYLNGAILGMSRAEIRKKFDEIVAFAEVEKFLDTPVKRYSSGMYVRLAFAVAAHLEPEILVVDEVLAVGDAEFQKKCLGKMGEVARQGRTVLFVSHNMGAIRQLCHFGLLLRAGGVQFKGAVHSAILEYVQAADSASARFDRSEESSKNVYLKAGQLQTVFLNEHLKCTFIELKLFVSSRFETKINVDVRIKDDNREPIAIASSGAFNSISDVMIFEGTSEFTLLIDFTDFAVGEYFLSVDLTVPWVEYLDRCEDCLKYTKNNQDWRISTTALKQSYGLGNLLLDLKLIS
jgi:lipopolysaccharide transport system ATP-binding protein